MANSDDPNEKSHKILQDLYDNLNKYDEQQLSALLSDFRILTREKTLTDEILDARCIKLLVDCAKSSITESQKCISNLILNYAQIRQGLVQPYVDCVETRLKNELSNENDHVSEENREKKEKARETLYYDLRIIFLLSALCPASRASIRDRLIDPILSLTRRESFDINQDNFLLIIESLKTLFNLTLDKCINNELAAEVIKKLFSIVSSSRDINVDRETGAKLDPTDQLLVNLIHLLTNMPKEVYYELSDEDVDKVLRHLEEQLKTLTKSSFKDTILPVLNACANICRYKEEVRERWFEEIIGSTKDFEKRPEEYDTLRGRLVKLMTSVDIHVKDIAAEFLYALCGGDTEKFITYTGFGNSAAYLSTRGLLTQSAKSALGANKGTEGRTDDGNPMDDANLSCSEKQYLGLRSRLDPITGKLDTPKKSPMEGMSEEEKEMHAHELADAITKLSKLGVMKPMSINHDGETSDLRPRSPPPPEDERKSS